MCFWCITTGFVVEGHIYRGGGDVCNTITINSWNSTFVQKKFWKPFFQVWLYWMINPLGPWGWSLTKFPLLPFHWSFSAVAAVWAILNEVVSDNTVQPVACWLARYNFSQTSERLCDRRGRPDNCSRVPQSKGLGRCAERVTSGPLQCHHSVSVSARNFLGIREECHAWQAYSRMGRMVDLKMFTSSRRSTSLLSSWQSANTSWLALLSIECTWGVPLEVHTDSQSE